MPEKIGCCFALRRGEGLIAEMCAFGGEDLRTHNVTTATYPIAHRDHEKQPLVGAVFSMRVDVPGLPQPLFGG
jgi:sugar lactone lactonase YvrE